MKKIFSIFFFMLLLGQLAFSQMPGVDIRPPGGNGAMHYKSNDNMVSNFTPSFSLYPLMPYASCMDLRRGQIYVWNTISWVGEDIDNGLRAQVAYTVTNPSSNIATGWNAALYNRMTVNYTSAGPDTMRIDLPSNYLTQQVGETFVVDVNNSRTVDADTLLVHFDSLFRTYDGKLLTEWKCPPRGRIWMAFRVHVSVEGFQWVEVDDILGAYGHGSGGGGGAQEFTQTQAAHGFTVGQLIYFHDASTAQLAKSDVGLADSVAQWAVSEIVNDSTFKYCNTCEVALTTGYTVGSYIWLDTILGEVTNVQPTATNCQYVGVVRSDSTIWAHIGDLCGGGGGDDWNSIYRGSGTVPDSNVIATFDNTDALMALNAVTPFQVSEDGFHEIGFEEWNGSGSQRSFIGLVNDGSGFNTAEISAYDDGSGQFAKLQISPFGSVFSDNIPSSHGMEYSSFPAAPLEKTFVWKKYVDDAIAAARPYKVYTALLTQSGTSAPVATVLENTLGGSVIWTRDDVGIYFGTLTGAFTAGKCFPYSFTSPSNWNAYTSSTERNDDDSIVVALEDSAGVPLEISALSNGTYVEIRVYN